MKSAVKQMSPRKVNRIYENAKTKGSSYFTLPGTNTIVFSRNSCLVNGYVYAECLVGNNYTAFRLDTIAGSSAQVAFIPTNLHVSPF